MSDASGAIHDVDTSCVFFVFMHVPSFCRYLERDKCRPPGMLLSKAGKYSY